MTLKPGAKSSPKLSIDWLKSQAKNVQKEVLETLTALSESKAQALLWNWPFWARQDQLPPPGTWTSWMMLGGRNLLAIETDGGWEVVQYTTAELTGTRRYRLSGLLRGAYGSNAAMVPSIPAGAYLCAIDKSLTPLDIRPENLPEHLSLHYGPGNLPPDSYGWRTSRHALHRFAARCLRPVHLKAVGRAGADMQLRWVRRSRVGGDDFNAFEVPLGETTERYRVRLSVEGRIFFETETQTPEWIYARTLQTAHAEKISDDLPATVQLGVAQMSAEFGAGPEAVLNLKLSVEGKYDTKRNT